MRPLPLLYSVLAVGVPLVCAAPRAIHVNQIGYEFGGPQSAVLEWSSNPGSVAPSCAVVGETGALVTTVELGPVMQVDGWRGRWFRRAVMNIETAGTYRLSCEGVQSPPFAAGKDLLYAGTAEALVGFFGAMRNTSQSDRAVQLYGSSRTHDVYGGYNDATGDRGKYLSHLSFANYFNPQQIPLVVWSLLEALPMAGPALAGKMRIEAAWGADYLVRVLDPRGFFYLTVFDGWGWLEPREICAWSGSEGVRSGAYQAGMREGAGMAIAALARASAAGVAGTYAPSRYLDAARTAWVHLAANPSAYLDNGEPNIIDDYCALLAATELYAATSEQKYRDAAERYAASLMSRQHGEGYFWADDQTSRPFYHASDEGLPQVALARYASQIPGAVAGVAGGLRRAVDWYARVTLPANPFGYARMIAAPAPASGGEGQDLARNRPVTASRTQPGYPPELAVDGVDDGGSRWASGQPYCDTEWIEVDLGALFEVNRVVLVWEAAYGKRYEIRVSIDGHSWITAATVNDGGSGRREIPLSNVNARHVRMQGLERGMEYGFSLYSFEVYGSATGGSVPSAATRFFIPHANETGYWWQGENARLASMAAALTVSAMTADPSQRFGPDSTTTLAVDQLDWILGKNPFGICMMYGMGANGTYPDYPGKPGYAFANIKGGICNGITAARHDETDIEWMPYHAAAGDSLWQDWRWIEQWLPHNAWFLVAVTKLKELAGLPEVSAYRSGTGVRGARARPADAAPRLVPVVYGRKRWLESPIAGELYTLDGRRVSRGEPTRSRAGQGILIVRGRAD